MRIRITNADGSVTAVEGLAGSVVQIEVDDAVLTAPTYSHQQKGPTKVRSTWRWERRQNVKDGQGNEVSLVLISRNTEDLNDEARESVDA